MASIRRTVAVRAAAAGAAVFCALTFLPAISQADPQPSISEVERQLASLQADAESATEDWLAAKLDAQKAQQQLDKLNAKVARSQASLDSLRKEVGAFAAAAYRSGGVDQSLQLLLASDPSQFLEQASDLDGIARRQSDLMHEVVVASQQLDSDKLVAKQQAAALAQIQANMAAKKQTIDQKVAEAQRLLNSLKAEERRKLAAQQARERAASQAAARAAEANRSSRSRSTWNGGGSSVATSSRAAGAVRFALAQVGKAYVYAASGPNAYDCSGLTMAAYRSVGVYLPHQSSAQYSSGRHISASELRPGDLVFYYSPIHHVGMYIGNGMIVHAANPSEGVRIAPLYSMPYVGAVRP